MNAKNHFRWGCYAPVEIKNMKKTDKIVAWIKKNPIKSLVVPTAISSMTFVINLIEALSDGNLSQKELHMLLTSANGIESIALIAIMIAAGVSL